MTNGVRTGNGLITITYTLPSTPTTTPTPAAAVVTPPRFTG
jgi:hypothetical protein